TRGAAAPTTSMASIRRVVSAMISGRNETGSQRVSLGEKRSSMPRLPSLADFPPWFLIVFAVALGLVLGSFLNVVIHRLPRGESLAFPGSHCPHCGQPIKPRDNVPVLSYLVLLGRSRCCKTPISPRYPLVEAIGGLVAWAVMRSIVLE